jgi:nicotinate phosphoribosyltransferase
VRAILDAGGLNATGIFCSGGIDETEVQRLLAAGAPIDGFGIGTHMDTSSDAPFLDCAYKLQEYAGIARRKRSEGKVTWPGRKQIYRQYDNGGRLRADLLTLEDDPQEGEALLHPFMKNGQRLAWAEPLEVIRQRTQQQLMRLPAPLTRLDEGFAFPVSIAPALRALAAAVDLRIIKN